MKKYSERGHWEKFWNRDREISEVYPHSSSLIDNLVKVVSLENKLVLEVGAGSGRDSLTIHQRGGKVAVLDNALSSLDTIKMVFNQNKAQPLIVMGDALRLPFADNTFDLVFHQGLLEHFRNPRPMLKEHVRVLKEGGLLLVDVPQRYHIYTVIKHILIALNKWFAGWETEFTVRQLRSLLKGEGLSIVQQYGDWFYPSLIYRMLREIGFRIGIKLPLYPSFIPVLSRLRKKIRNYMVQQPIVLYTGNNIGIIARKEQKRTK